MKVGFRYTDDLNPWSLRGTNTSRKDNLLSCSFSIVNRASDKVHMIQ